MMKAYQYKSATTPAAVCVRSGQDAEGSFTEAYTVLPETDTASVRHRYPRQKIRLEAIAGSLGVMLEDRSLLVEPGHALDIPENTEHKIYNAGDQELIFREVVRPALHAEWLNKELRASARRRKPGLLALLEQSYILDQIRGEYYRSGFPHRVNALLAKAGKWLGLDKKISPVR